MIPNKLSEHLDLRARERLALRLSIVLRDLYFKMKALAQCQSGDILIGRFTIPLYNMAQPLILIGDCVGCCTEKPEVIQNVQEILIRSEGGFITIWKKHQSLM